MEFEEYNIFHISFRFPEDIASYGAMEKEFLKHDEAFVKRLVCTAKSKQAGLLGRSRKRVRMIPSRDSRISNMTTSLQILQWTPLTSVD